MSIKIFIAAHKNYEMPEDDIYIPLEVGASLRKDLGLKGVRDNTGLNISEKNPNYCELTGYFWIWKNIKDADVVGLVHYRRYFKGNSKVQGKFANILNAQEIEKCLRDYQVILPVKRNYFIETVRSQYAHAHHEEDLLALEKAIRKICPTYLSAFEQVMNSKKLHLLNMFVMKKELFDEYCTWLFSVLAEVENTLNISEYSKNDARVYGFLSERLLDVWLIKNKIRYCELPVLNLEPVNWPQKIAKFLIRKAGLKKLIE